MLSPGKPHQVAKNATALTPRPIWRWTMTVAFVGLGVLAYSIPSGRAASGPPAAPKAAPSTSIPATSAATKAGTPSADAIGAANGSFAVFQKTVQPFLAAHCYSCHDENDSEGNVRLDTLTTADSLAKGLPTLDKAVKMLSMRKMPPKEEPRPTEEEYAAITTWMNAYADVAYNSGPINPGRVTIHRLNRAEYDNTIRDLFGFTEKDAYHPADTFPADSVGFGFDNNVDVLTIAPVLFEKYIKAAAMTLDKAIAADPVVLPPSIDGPPVETLKAYLQDGTPAPIFAASPLAPAGAPAAASGFGGRGGRGNAQGGAPVAGVAGGGRGNAAPAANSAAVAAGGRGNPAFAGAGRGGAGGRGAPPSFVFQLQGYASTNVVFPADGNYIFSLKGFQAGTTLGNGARGGANGQIANVLFYVDNQPVVPANVDPTNLQAVERNVIRVTAASNAITEYSSVKFHVTAGPHQVVLYFRNGATKDAYTQTLADNAAAAAAAAAAPPVADAQAPVVAAVDSAAPAGSPVVAAADPNAAPAAASGSGGRGRGAGGRGAGARGAGARGAGGPTGPQPIVAGYPILGVTSIRIEGPQFTSAAAMPERMPESYRRIMVALPSSTVTRAQAAEKIIRNFATRAYRRPATEDEVQSLMDLFAKVDIANRPFDKSIAATLQAVLLNTNFLFRVEQDPQATEAGNIHTLNDFELASRLSYFLWSSMPDDELFALAAKGQLRANLDAQVTRMLKDPKAGALTENFAGQWLQLRQVDDVAPDQKAVPDFDPELKTAMLKETQMFFSSIKDEDRSVLDFINANYTFVNPALAKLYGLEDVAFDDNDNSFKRVTFPNGSPRGGLLTQASVLAITSYPNRTSPVKRGKWVLENLLDDAPPPPPPNVPAIDDEKQLTGTFRQQMEQHRVNPVCASCHERMDAIGFSLENFDVIGTWRDKDANNEVIDAAGAFPDGTKFSGAGELKKILLASQDKFCRCLASKMLSYAIGRSVEPFDKRTVNDIVSTTQKNGDKFSALIKAIVHSDAFQKRRGNSTGDNS